MFFESYETFREYGIPSFLDEKKRLKVFLASYNKISNRKPGPVMTGDPNLGMAFYMGHRDWTEKTVEIPCSSKGEKVIMTIAGIHGAVAVPANPNDRLCQLSVGGLLHKVRVEEAESAVLIAYAGRMPLFEESVGEAIRFGQQNPGATIVIVTCDCDVAIKKEALSPFLEDGSVTHAVAVRDCGGHTSMERIIRAITNRWFGTR